MTSQQFLVGYPHTKTSSKDIFKGYNTKFLQVFQVRQDTNVILSNHTSGELHYIHFKLDSLQVRLVEAQLTNFSNQGKRKKR